MSDIQQKRFFIQGKQLSQMITYIWRWADEDPEKDETKNARKLKKYFEDPNGENEGEGLLKLPLNQLCAAKRLGIGVTSFMSIENLEKQVNQTSKNLEEKINQRLKKLLRANPRDWLKTNPGKPVQEAPEEVKLLIAVFGKEKIKDENKYLSPIFNSAELADEGEGPHYEFIIDPNSFQGTLQDPDIQNPQAFRYLISFPPAPKFGEATVTECQLENWIKNDELNEIFPPSIYIPVSTS